MNETTKTRRGKLDFKLTTSSTQIEAGKEFSVSIAITNPFDIPIKVKKVATKLPIEFIDVTRERLKKQEHLLEEKLKDLIKAEIPTLKINKENKNRLISDLSKEIFRAIPMVGGLFAVGSTVAEYMLASNISTTASIEKLTNSISSSDVKKIVTEAKTVPNPEIAIKENLIKLLESKVYDLKKVSTAEVLLHPGNSTIHVFTIKTSKSVLFSPSTYKLHMEIEYEADSLDQRDIIEYSLSISTSIRSMMFGAGTGSALGFFVNDIFNEKTIVTAMTSASFET
ncbi:MAG: hypothetical protein ABIJ31_07550, partial [Pseudomonadota bacterium]